MNRTDLKTLVGQSFGRLTVISFMGVKNYAHRPHRFWLCECVCGNTTELHTGALTSGRTRSCGCLPKGNISGHGMSNTRTRTSWVMMKQRCLNPKHPAYKNYGGRGIRVCGRWLKSFENFLADMGERPEGKTLDRYPDPNGDHEKSNCRWATASQQNFNKRKR